MEATVNTSTKTYHNWHTYQIMPTNKNIHTTLPLWISNSVQDRMSPASEPEIYQTKGVFDKHFGNPIK